MGTLEQGNMSQGAEWFVILIGSLSLSMYCSLVFFILQTTTSKFDNLIGPNSSVFAFLHHPIGIILHWGFACMNGAMLDMLRSEDGCCVARRPLLSLISSLSSHACPISVLLAIY